MAKFASPLLGYNNNVRHKGRVFHIQTEDSGINHPHIITHLFMDGGRILKSVKTSYAEHVGTESMADKVRGMMKDQHKAMFIALRDGTYDEVAFGKKTTSSPENKAVPPPAPSEPESVSNLIVEPPVSQRMLVHAPASSSAIADGSPAVKAKTELAMPVARTDDLPPSSTRVPVRPTDPPATTREEAATEVEVVRRDDSSVEVIVGGISEIDLGDEGVGIPAIDEELRRPPSPPPVPPSAPRTERRGPSAADLTLDFDALERDTDPSMSPLFRQGDLPPPPANLLASSQKERTGAYRAHQPEPREEPITKTYEKLPPPSEKDKAAQVAETGRYAPARPATIFGATAKQTQPSSLFGDDLVSDKSLDEVILSYLAEDLDPPRRK